MRLKERLARSKKFVKMLHHVPDSVIQMRKKPGITIELTNVCNLKCPLCPTNTTMTREKGFMTLENFKTIVDEIKDIKSSISMDFSGEPTLNKDTFKMVRYAADNDMETMISTNMTNLHKFNFDDIVKSGLTYLMMAVDGLSQKTEGKYRVGADFKQVFKNMKGIVKAKKKLNSKTPLLEWQFIVMKHNEHEIPKVIEIADKIGVDKLVLKSLCINTDYEISKQTIEKIQKKTGIYLPSKKYTRQKTGSVIRICPWIWQSVIFWNGDIGICCFDFNREIKIGNIFKDGGFKKVWRSKKYREARKKILKGELKICKSCDKMEKTENFSSTFIFKKDGKNEISI